MGGVFLLLLLLDVKKDFIPLLAHIKGASKFDKYTIYHNEELENAAKEKFYKSEIYLSNDLLMKESLKENEICSDERDPSYKEIEAITFKNQNFSYVYVNVIFGDYCGNQKYGCYYANISLIWDVHNNSYEIIDFLKYEPYYEFVPLFNQNSELGIVGFIKKDFKSLSSYLKIKGWKNFQTLTIPTHECD